jgi:hypothetical protein
MTRAIVAHSKATVLGGLVRVPVETQKCGHLWISDQNDVATVTTVATIRTGEWLELLTTNGDTAVSAVSGTQMKRDVVDEGGHVSSFFASRKNLVHLRIKRGDELFQLAPSKDGVPALLRRDDVDDLAATLRTKLNCASSKSEQGVVAATTDVGAGVEVRATLTNDDFARENLLAAEALHSETLCV